MHGRPWLLRSMGARPSAARACNRATAHQRAKVCYTRLRRRGGHAKHGQGKARRRSAQLLPRARVSTRCSKRHGGLPVAEPSACNPSNQRAANHASPRSIWFGMCQAGGRTTAPTRGRRTRPGGGLRVGWGCGQAARAGGARACRAQQVGRGLAATASGWRAGGRRRRHRRPRPSAAAPPARRPRAGLGNKTERRALPPLRRRRLRCGGRGALRCRGSWPP